MNGNFTLNQAKYSSDNRDEWYTTYETIEEELTHYQDHFNGKTVICNCNDSFNSNFVYYFLCNFNKLKLKKLICTSYAGPRIDLIQNNDELSFFETQSASSKHGSVLIVTETTGITEEEISRTTIQKVLSEKGMIKQLEGDGDFRSKECIELLKESDICCTNPPFSLFSDLFSLLVKFKKQYLIIGNQNAITYKNVFPYIKEGKTWVGYRFGDMSFRVPSDTEPRSTRFWVDETGQKWRSIGNAMWLTNLDIPKRHEKLSLTKKYNLKEYPRYDNFDGIHVKTVRDIPMDYEGVMGVPITFLKFHNNSQFEIVGEANHGSDNEFDLFKPKINGKECFKRILIQKKQNV